MLFITYTLYISRESISTSPPNYWTVKTYRPKGKHLYKNQIYIRMNFLFPILPLDFLILSLFFNSYQFLFHAWNVCRA